MYRVALRKQRVTLCKQTEVLAPMRTGPGGVGAHVHSVLAGATQTEPAPPNDHTHEIRPGDDMTQPGGLDKHTHSLPTMVKQLSATPFEARREILDGEMIFLSLVDAGSNMATVIMKDAKGTPLQRIEAVAKLSSEGLLYNLVYGPNQVDTHGDFASKQGVKNICHKFIPNMIGSGIDVMHNCQPVDPKDAHLCENFIIQKNGDDRFKGVTVNGRTINDTTELEGWWATVIKLNAPHLRAPFESGEWTGVSMYGPALVQSVQKSDFTKALADRLGINSKETDMNEQELAKAIAAALSPLVEKVEALAKSVTAPATNEPKTEPTEPKTEIEFEGDLDNLEDVQAHEERLFRSGLDLNKPADLKKWKAHLVKKAEDQAALKAAADSKDSDELKKAKAEAEVATARVAELAKSSNQTTEDVKGSETADERVVRIRKRAKEVAKQVVEEQNPGRK